MSKGQKVLYIAGPMTGIPQFNFPLFDAVAHELRNDGWTIISPAETDHEQTRAAAMESPDGAIMNGVVGVETWGDCLARDVKMLADGVDVEETDKALRARMKAAADAHTGEDPMPPLIRIPNATQLKIDGIAFLPGWEKSRGARLEAFVGLLTGKAYYTVEPNRDISADTAESRTSLYQLYAQSPEWVQHMLAKDWADAILLHKPL